MAPAYTIRDGVDADIETIVAFTLQEALEAEGIEADETSVGRGVERAFGQAALARYWMAETANSQVVASVSVVTEWSNFHGGHYWWIQSLFIVSEHRGSGLVEQLIDHLARAAAAAGALDVRLYASNLNERAIRAYGRCGFKVAPYVIMSRGRPTDESGAVP